MISIGLTRRRVYVCESAYVRYFGGNGIDGAHGRQSMPKTLVNTIEWMSKRKYWVYDKQVQPMQI